MKRLLLVLPFVLAACDSGVTAPREGFAPAAPRMSAQPGTCTLANGSTASTGFDTLGYNRCARIFSGPADGTDKILDNKVWGDPTYAADHLVMKWNAAWDVCNAFRTPENCAGAWTDNEWNGKVQGGSGETWHYKFQWVGACGAYGTPIADGGYCIWDEYEVIFSHGTDANQHFWDAHANPAGYGN